MDTLPRNPSRTRPPWAANSAPASAHLRPQKDRTTRARCGAPVVRVEKELSRRAPKVSTHCRLDDEIDSGAGQNGETIHALRTGLPTGRAQTRSAQQGLSKRLHVKFRRCATRKGGCARPSRAPRSRHGPTREGLRMSEMPSMTGLTETPAIVWRPNNGWSGATGRSVQGLQSATFTDAP